MGNGSMKQSIQISSLPESELQRDDVRTSRMDKVKRILSSPVVSRRVATAPQSRYFGVALDDLLRREGSTVPHLVTKICRHIELNGLDQEGIFRINGNARVVDRIRASFDSHGDADLGVNSGVSGFNGADMTALASALKLFLRELPDGLIPEENTRVFISTQHANQSEPAQCLRELQTLVGRLPAANLHLLGYLCRFLALLAGHEQGNKMSAHALAIVFGPNIFRFEAGRGDRGSEGLAGLKEQGVTNYIVMRFIKECDAFFKPPLRDSDGDRREAPARPPPPKFSRESAETPPDGGTVDLQNSGVMRGVEADGLDSFRSSSPFPLDSDRSECGSSTVTPRVTPFHSQQVDAAISNVISRHLFADSPPGSSGSELPDTPTSPASTPRTTAHNAPVPAPRRKWRPKGATIQPQPMPSAGSVEKSDPDDEPSLTVQQRIQKLSEKKVAPEVIVKDATRLPKQRPKSRAFEMFESQGILIGMAPHATVKALTEGDDSDDEDGHSSRPVREDRREVTPSKETIADRSPVTESSDGLRRGVKVTSPAESHAELEVVQRTTTPLTSFKRPSGPKNRRNPTRGSRRCHDDGAETDVTVSDLTPSEAQGPAEGLQAGGEGPAVAPSIRFLSYPPPGCGGDGRANVAGSPSTTHKPFVPPLDLSILHEHVDGGDAIRVDQSQSLCLQQPGKDSDEALVSPRMSKLRKKTNGQRDTDVPPSPPTQQYIIYSSPTKQDDEHAAQIKHITKRIQSYKRKIKTFEEHFEHEHGYQPSQSDKAARPDVKRHVIELARSRKELKRLKEELENEPPQMAPLWPDHRGDDEALAMTLTDCTATKMETTLESLQQRLTAKREDAGRPHDLGEMSHSQAQEEKLAVQKALLYFESIHGRPSTKSEKDVMRPLYDRYRNIKKLLAKPVSPHEKSFELPTVPEDTTMECLLPASAIGGSGGGDSGLLRAPIRIPTAPRDDIDFLVSQLCRPDTLGVTGDASPPTPDVSPAPLRHMSPSSSLHELTVRQLHQEHQSMLTDKKRLRRQLRSFEDDFLSETGRKVQKEDRAPMDSEYHDYKQIKARLRLLDALISKHSGVESEA